jgi:hypothetical protein
MRKSKIILGLALILLLVDLGQIFGQASKTFTGKISEIAKGSELDINKKDTFYILRLDEYPKIKFRLTPEDAVRFGVIEGTGTSGVITPRMSKGLGWKVKLTCDPNNLGENKAPIYKVTALVKLDD